jgi:hypothetical protein
MRYVIARVITSPTGHYRTARLVVTDAPPKTTLEQVLEALERAGRAAEFSEAGVPFGNHEVRADGTRGWPYGITGIDTAPAITWADLTADQPKAAGKRITLRPTPAQHARYKLAAEREGVSLDTWMLRAADHAAAPVAAHRPADQAEAAS